MKELPLNNILMVLSKIKFYKIKIFHIKMASLFLNNNRPTSHHEEYNSEEIVKKYTGSTC